MAIYCGPFLSDMGEELTQIFSKAAIQAIQDVEFNGAFRNALDIENIPRFRALISEKFCKAWPNKKKDILKHVIESTLFSQCIEHGCKYFRYTTFDCPIGLTTPMSYSKEIYKKKN